MFPGAVKATFRGITGGFSPESQQCPFHFSNRYFYFFGLALLTNFIAQLLHKSYAPPGQNTPGAFQNIQKGCTYPRLSFLCSFSAATVLWGLGHSIDADNLSWTVRDSVSELESPRETYVSCGEECKYFLWQWYADSKIMFDALKNI